MAQESSLERPVLLVVLVAVAGIAAGTAAAVTATVFPYALTLAIKHLRTKAKKDPKDPSSSSSGKSGILKGDSKTRSAKSKHADGSASAANDPKDVISLEVKRRKDCLVRSILKWTDIDVTFDTFPYYLNDITKTVLVNTTFVRLRRSDFLKFTPPLHHLGGRILLTGPPGSEKYQELLVRALARHLKVRLLVFDSAALSLEPSPPAQPLLAESETQAEDQEASSDRPKPPSPPNARVVSWAEPYSSLSTPDPRSNADSGKATADEKAWELGATAGEAGNGDGPALNGASQHEAEQGGGSAEGIELAGAPVLGGDAAPESTVSVGASTVVLRPPRELSPASCNSTDTSTSSSISSADRAVSDVSGVGFSGRPVSSTRAEVGTAGRGAELAGAAPGEHLGVPAGVPDEGGEADEALVLPRDAEGGSDDHELAELALKRLLSSDSGAQLASRGQAGNAAGNGPGVPLAGRDEALGTVQPTELCDELQEGVQEVPGAALSSHTAAGASPSPSLEGASSAGAGEGIREASVQHPPEPQPRIGTAHPQHQAEPEAHQEGQSEAQRHKLGTPLEANSSQDPPRVVKRNVARRPPRSVLNSGSEISAASDGIGADREGPGAGAAGAGTPGKTAQGGPRDLGASGGRGGSAGAGAIITTTAKAPAPATATNVSASTSSSRKSLRKGDRVKYAGGSAAPSHMSPASLLNPSILPWSLPPQSSRMPPVGSKGRIVLVVEETPGKVGVRFDKPFVGGSTLLDLCEDGHGCFCNVSDLRLEGTSSPEDLDKLTAEVLLEVATAEATREPLIVYIKNAESSCLFHYDRFLKLEKLDRLEAVVFGGHTCAESPAGAQAQKKEKLPTAGAKNPRDISALLDLSILDQLSSRLDDSRGILEGSSKAARILAKIFPMRIPIRPPQEEKQVQAWSKQFESDADVLRAHNNALKLQAAMQSASVECRSTSTGDLHELCSSMTGMPLLPQDVAEKIIGWAVSRHLQETREPTLTSAGRAAAGGTKLVIERRSLQHAVALFMASQQPTSLRPSLKDVVCDNEFETMLLSEVVPPEELGVSFESIGALDSIKETLREVVMLPLQRPELFRKGQLTKPTRGLLLFGPPGTGKTMLAKAVATESGANFIDVSTASIASKWFGEAEKYVKAVFTLAAKISPCVIFVDEVDSMLGRRGKDTEHSAMRKVKNEFMSSWDGLRTKDCNRILVLGATNRPFDLDDAVVRRFPRRLMVDVPDVENRAKILSVILKDEDLAPDVDIQELARVADGYTGSDLRNLCISAAFLRIKDFLRDEDKRKAAATKAKDKGAEAGAQSGAEAGAEVGTEAGVEAEGETGAPLGGQGAAAVPAPQLRSISMADFRAAMERVKASVCMDAASMQELSQWNEQYGEGGTGKRMTLTYFM